MKRTLKGHSATVLCCASLESSPTTVASGGEDGRLCFFDLRSSDKAVQTYEIFQGEAVASLCFKPGCEEMCYAAAGSSVYCVDSRLGPSGSEFARYQWNEDEINQVAVNRKATYLAACDESGVTKIIDLQNQRLYKTLRGGHTNICSSVVFHPQKPWEVFTGGLDCKLNKWDFGRGKIILSLDAGSPVSGSDTQLWNPPYVHALACPGKSFTGENGRLLAVGRGDGAVDVFDMSCLRGEPKCHLTGHMDAVSTVIFAEFCELPKLVISGANDATIKIWDWTAPEEERLKHSIDHGRKANWLASSAQNLVVADTSKHLTVYCERSFQL